MIGNFLNARKICLHPYLFPAVYPSDVNSDDEDFCDHWIENSGKLKVLDKLLDKMFKEGHKVFKTKPVDQGQNSNFRSIRIPLTFQQ